MTTILPAFLPWFCELLVLPESVRDFIRTTFRS